ncbi:MAG: NAD(P)-dependent oxidoreductase [Candidatus Peregrinibacteria bacterium]|nr:NAD(P)-dependent oxidoreductase [Candidatus Peregrinibacteria bacterium]
MAHRTLFLDVEETDRPLVREHFSDAVFAEASLRDEKLIEACKDATIVSCFITTPFPRSVIQKLPKLKLLCTRSVGYDHIDIDACREKDITVCNVPDYGSHVIAEHVFALLLSTLRHIRAGEDRVESGTFDYHGLRGIALKGKTIGILGTGKIGRKVAKIAHGYEMRILATDQCRTVELETELGVQYVSFDELLQQSDILTLHVPGMKETEHLLNAKAFQRMKDGVVLVNTARGSLIDSAALLKALDSGKVAYALLDVLEHEQNFKENETLIKHPNVVTTPHVAFYADDSMRNMYLDAILSIEQWIAGKEPAHVVHPLQIVCDLPGVKK